MGSVLALALTWLCGSVDGIVMMVRMEIQRMCRILASANLEERSFILLRMFFSMFRFSCENEHKEVDDGQTL